MPLNQLAFLSAGLALRMGKKEVACLIFVHKNGIPFRPGMRPEAEFSGPHLQAAWLEPYCTGSSLLSSTARVFRQISSARRDFAGRI